MKVLFVSSGNSEKGISPIVLAQGKSLKENGIKIEYFTIKGKGLKGYIANILPLRKKLKRNNYNLIHSHYSLTSFIASIAKIGLRIPQVTSLMGSDVNSNKNWKKLIRFFNTYFWDSAIVKSEDMKNKVNLKDITIIPNGVSFSDFQYIESNEAKNILGYDRNKSHIIWVSNPGRAEKNYQLAEEAVKSLNDDKIELHVVNGIPHSSISNYMYAADVLLLTSFWEGSPNVVKEAMACNLPIVATKVGDVKWLFGKEPGHYLTEFNYKDVADKINSAIEFKRNYGKTTGRERLLALEIDSRSISEKIINVYKKVLKNED